MDESVYKSIRDKTLEMPALDVKPFVDRIVQRYGERVVGIYMYGSVLSKVTSTKTSFPDFFVITDRYRGVFRKLSHWILAYFLPPHIYHLRLDENRQCKYNLVSYKRFSKECSKKAKDIYILGRFSKRVSLVYHRDEEYRDKLVDCCVSAMSNVVPWTLRGMSDSFDDVDFALNCLNLSYAGETRVETSSKVPKLFASEEELYKKVYPSLLVSHPIAQKMAAPTNDGKYKIIGGKFARKIRSIRFKWFLKKSRIRGILRWPKFLVTVDEWIDIIFAKIERTKGIKLEATPLQRRYPLIFGWRHFFRLLKAGAIRSSKTPPRDKK
jgi:hypothetical protein